MKTLILWVAMFGVVTGSWTAWMKRPVALRAAESSKHTTDAEARYRSNQPTHWRSYLLHR